MATECRLVRTFDPRGSCRPRRGSSKPLQANAFSETKGDPAWWRKRIHSAKQTHTTAPTGCFR